MAIDFRTEFRYRARWWPATSFQLALAVCVLTFCAGVSPPYAAPMDGHWPVAKAVPARQTEYRIVTVSSQGLQVRDDLGVVLENRPSNATPDAIAFRGADTADATTAAGYWSQRQIVLYNAAGFTLTEYDLSSLQQPTGLALAGRHAMVLDAASGKLFVFGPGEPIARTLPGTDGARDFDWHQGLAWTVHRDGLRAHALSGQEVLRVNAVEAGCPFGVARIASAGAHLLVACGDGLLVKLETRSLQVQTLALLDAPPRALASTKGIALIFADGFEAPPIELLSPTNGSAVNQASITLNGRVRNDVLALTLDSQTLDITGGAFSAPVALAEGSNAFLLEATLVGGGNGSLLVALTLDTQVPTPPVISFVVVSEPDAGQVDVDGQAASVEGLAFIEVSNDRTGQVASAGADALGRFSVQLSGQEADLLTLLATDAAGNVSAPAQAQVPLVNDPPVLDPVGARSVDLGRSLAFTVSASDPESDPLAFSADPVPAGARFDGVSGQFSFRPAPAQVGSLNLTIQVSDGEMTDAEAITLTVVQPPAMPTAISGRVLDTNDFTTDGTETPVVGAVVSILDSGVSDVTDASGAFALNAVPSGRVILDIATAGASPAPDGSDYAGFREAITLIPDVENAIDRPFFLPRITTVAGNMVVADALSVIRNDALGVRIEIPPHTAKAEDGSDYEGPMSISLVPDAVAPAALPENLGFGMLITIQPVGVYFNAPVPIFFPNQDGWDANTEADLWSLDPNLGEFSVVGTVRVVGNELRTVAGGVIAADWHGFLARQLILELEELDGCDVCRRLREALGSETVVSTGALRLEHPLATYRSVEQERGLTLVYDSSEASPAPVVSTAATISLLRPGVVSSRLRVNGISGPENFYSTAGIGTGERLMVAGQADLLPLPTGMYPYQLDITSRFQFSWVSTAATGSIPVINASNSPFGAGWSLDGFKRIHEQTDGSLLLVTGGGSSALFQAQRAGTGRFSGPRAFTSSATTFARFARNPMLADLNNDTFIDFAFVDGSFSSQISSDLHVEIYSGDGTGNFTRSRSDIASIPVSSTLANVDNNASLDLVVCGGDFIDVHVNTGTGFSTENRLNANNINGCENIVATDFNQDGYPDFAYPDRAAGNNMGVGLLLSNVPVPLPTDGFPAYDPQVTINAGARTDAVASGLFNADLFPDLAVSNLDGDSVTVFLGDGNGGFDAGTVVNAGDGPTAIASGDINGDGITDLVTANNNDNTVSVLRGDGLGGFASNVTVATGSRPRGIAVGDLDGDGNLDLATTSSDDTISVLINNGSGGFAQRSEFLTHSQPQTLAIADLDGDGIADVLSNSPDAGMGLLRGLGGGRLDGAPTVREVDGNPIGEDLVVADFDNDFIPDVATGMSNGGRVQIYRGTGNGFAGPPLQVFTGQFGGFTAAADLDLDGDMDLVNSSEPNNRMVAVLNNGDGSFDTANDVLSPLPNAPQDFEVAELTGDGLPDLVALHRNPANSSLREVTLMRGQGDGSFVALSTVTVTTAAPRRLALGDVDGDGDLDVVTLTDRGTTNGDQLAVYFNDGAGNLGGEVISSGFSSDSARQLALADLDGDGVLDAAFVSESNLAASQGVVLAIGDGAGNFIESPPLLTTCGPIDDPDDVVVADYDGDGILDLTVTCVDDAQIEIYRNDGNASFALAGRVQSSHRGAGGLTPSDIAYLDFNRDGALDIVAFTNQGLQYHGAIAGGDITGYRAPRRDFSKLVKNPDDSFTRSLAEGTVEQYDSGGRLSSITDRNGNTTSYAYDGAGRLVSLTDPVGKTTTLTYAGGRLSFVTDPAGRSTMLTHDAAGNLTAVSDPDSASRSFSYDMRHRLVSQTDARGQVTRYQYDRAGLNRRVLRPDATAGVIDPADSLLLSRSDGTGASAANPLPGIRKQDLESRLTDANGNLWRYQVNGRDAATRRIDPLGGMQTTFRNGADLPMRVVDETSVVTTFGYDAAGNLTSVRQAAGTPAERLIRNRFDRFGGAVELVDAAGNVSRIERDANGNITRIEDALGEQTLFSVNTRGLPTSITDRTGRVTSYAYDADFNLASVTNDAGVVTSYARDPAGFVSVTTRDANGALARSETVTRDAMNRVTTFTDGENQTVSAQYDAGGLLQQIQSPDRDPLVVSYDSRGRRTALARGSKIVETTAYDGVGQIIARADGAGGQVALLRDPLGRVIEQRSPLGLVQTFAWDAVGNLLSAVDGNGQPRTLSWDSLRRNTSISNALGEARMFEYDSRDNLVRVTRPDSSQVDYQFDELSRLIQVTAPDDTLTYDYDPEGRLTLAQDSDSVVTFTYDSLGRRSQATTLATSAQSASSLSFQYDDLDRLVSRQDSFGGSETYGYDNADRLSQVTPDSGGAINLAYDGTGALNALMFPNGVDSLLTRGADGQLAGALHEAGVAPLLTSDYQYDPRGLLTRQVDDGVETLFAYDELIRQTGASGSRSESYTYDAAGNRTSSHRSGTHVVDAANRLLQDDAFDYSYDAQGRLIQRFSRSGGGTRSLTWDSLGRLASVSLESGSVVQYAYDALGRRIQVDLDGSITRYLYDGADIAMELDGADALQARFSYGPDRDQPLAQIRGGSAWYYHAGINGNIRLLTDAAGAVANRYDYDSYGNPLQAAESVANPFRFTGREWNAASGDYFYRARYYDPQSGRFLSEDPLGLNAGDANLYRYLFDSPLNGRDPDGEIAPLIIALAIAAGAFTTASGFAKASANANLRIVEAQTLADSINALKDSGDPEDMALLARLQASVRRCQIRGILSSSEGLVRNTPGTTANFPQTSAADPFVSAATSEGIDAVNR